MTTTTDDRLTAIEAGVDELRLMVESAVKLAKASREDHAAVQARLASLDKTLTRLRADSEVVRGDMNLVRAGQQEAQDKISSIHMNGMTVSLRTGTIETTLAEQTQALQEHGEQLGEILETLRGSRGTS